ncbi:30S ribosomal protein S8, partial [Acinetobacter baumannii]|nr:30S ribosomal protein S8 [Acinetobacter baumannii]
MVDLLNFKNRADYFNPVSYTHLTLPTILRVQEGYISNVEVAQEETKSTLTITLKYFEGKPVIEMVKRVSRPG